MSGGPRARRAHPGRSPARAAILAPLVVAAALAATGCGLGPGAGIGDATLTVTRDFGRSALLERRLDDLRESDTVLRVLDSSARISTRYGGRFVQSIDGVTGGSPGGSPHDWFFFVNGVESPVGAADYRLRGGERIWWDYRDWSGSMRVPAVVGSWPEPFASGFEGTRHPVRVECLGGGEACPVVSRRVSAAAGRDAGKTAEPIRVLVGPWSRLRSDPAARGLTRGPAYSGVFAEIRGAGGEGRLAGLDAAGRAVRSFGPAAGLVAATRSGSSPPVWVVTGLSPAGVRAAARALGARDLRNRYAVIVEGGRDWAVPLR